MPREEPAAARPRHARRSTTCAAGLLVGLAIVLASGPGARGADSVPPALITIPPAHLPSLAAAAAVKPAPRELLPADIEVLGDPAGAGFAMWGVLAGKAESASGVILAELAHSRAFDAPAPAIRLLVADQGDRHAQALFMATAQGTPLLGIAAAALDAEGGSVTVFYDRAEAFAESFPRMRRALDEIAAVAIGMTDNSAAAAQRAGIVRAAAGWEPVVAAAADAGEAQGQMTLAQNLVDRLSGAAGDPWRIVPPDQLK